MCAAATADSIGKRAVWNSDLKGFDFDGWMTRAVRRKRNSPNRARVLYTYGVYLYNTYIHTYLYTALSSLSHCVVYMPRTHHRRTMTHWQYYMRFRLVFFFFNESFLRKFPSLSLSRPPTFLRASQTRHSILFRPSPNRTSFILRIIYRTVILFLVRFSTGIFDNRTGSCNKHTSWRIFAFYATYIITTLTTRHSRYRIGRWPHVDVHNVFFDIMTLSYRC